MKETMTLIVSFISNGLFLSTLRMGCNEILIIPAVCSSPPCPLFLQLIEMDGHRSRWADGLSLIAVQAIRFIALTDFDDGTVDSKSHGESNKTNLTF